MKSRFIHKPRQTYYILSTNDKTVNVVDDKGNTFCMPISKLAEFGEAHKMLINGFKRALSANGFEIIDGELIKKDNMQVTPIGVFYCNECGEAHPLSETYHTNKSGWRICEECYAKSLKKVDAVSKSKKYYYCFDCNRPFPLDGETYVNASGCRICPDCYHKSGSNHHHASSCACEKKHLISLSA